MRVPLLAGIILGGATIVGHTVFSDVVTGDFQAYYYGAQAAFDGESLYFDRGYEGGYYIYPPVTLVYFALYSELPFLAGYGLHTLVSVVVATLVARATIDVIRRHTTLTTADAVLVWAFFLFSSCAIASLSLGQVNILILGLIVLGYLQLERGQSLRSGASFAVAATPKLFPTLLGVYLLANRNWRATAAAITTGVGGIVLGAALFGVGLTENFFLWLVRDQGIKTDGLSANTVPPADLFIVTLARPLANFFPTFGFWEYLLLSITILAVPLAYVYTGSYRYDRLVGLLATLVAMVVIIPPQLIYGLFISPLSPVLRCRGHCYPTLVWKLSDPCKLHFRPGDVIERSSSLADPDRGSDDSYRRRQCRPPVCVSPVDRASGCAHRVCPSPVRCGG
jgi:hypothetical protein